MNLLRSRLPFIGLNLSTGCDESEERIEAAMIIQGNQSQSCSKNPQPMRSSFFLVFAPRSTSERLHFVIDLFNGIRYEFRG